MKNFFKTFFGIVMAVIVATLLFYGYMAIIVVIALLFNECATSTTTETVSDPEKSTETIETHINEVETGFNITAKNDTISE